MFEHLHKLDIREAMSWMDLPEIAPKARILLKPATEANRPYFNAMLKMSGKRVRHMARSDMMTVEDLAQNREDDRVLFPRYVIAGWEGFPDMEGNDVPHSVDHAADFCRQCPDWIFDRVRNHAGTQERFVPEEDDLPPDPAELAKNSENVSDSN
jgi:hypothetical protein